MKSARIIRKEVIDGIIKKENKKVKGDCVSTRKCKSHIKGG
jgi:hypothetical protein